MYRDAGKQMRSLHNTLQRVIGRSERVTLKDVLINNSKLSEIDFPDCKTKYLSLVNAIYTPPLLPLSKKSPLLGLSIYSKTSLVDGRTIQTTRG